jgi:hypothetical protein
MRSKNKVKLQPKLIIKETIKTVDNNNMDFVLAQKSIMLVKDYETAFQVYGREEVIVYNFRSWTITLVSAYLGFLLTKTNTLELRDAIPGIVVIFIFYILEVSERSVMKRIVEDVRRIENIFMETSELNLKKNILLYKFRDIRDKERNIIIEVFDFIKSLFAIQVIWWFIFITTTYIISLILISKVDIHLIFNNYLNWFPFYKYIAWLFIF